MELYLVRHGQSEWQVRESASRDSEITELGRIQSKYLNEYIDSLIKPDFDKNVIFVSPLKRSMQTVEGLKRQIIVEHRLKEAPFHVASKLPEFNKPTLYQRAVSNDNHYNSFKENIMSFLHEVINDKGGKRCFIYTHGGVIKTILRIIHDNDGLCYTIHNCSVTKLVWHRSRWHVSTLNDVSFLPQRFVT